MPEAMRLRDEITSDEFQTTVSWDKWCDQSQDVEHCKRWPLAPSAAELRLKLFPRPRLIPESLSGVTRAPQAV